MEKKDYLKLIFTIALVGVLLVGSYLAPTIEASSLPVRQKVTADDIDWDNLHKTVVIPRESDRKQAKDTSNLYLVQAATKFVVSFVSLFLISCVITLQASSVLKRKAIPINIYVLKHSLILTLVVLASSAAGFSFELIFSLMIKALILSTIVWAFSFAL